MQKTEHRFDKIYPNLKGCVFIVTYGRSGSTLLQNLLMTIPGCTIRGENHNTLQTIFNSVERAKRTKAEWGKDATDPSHPWYGANDIRPYFYGAGMIDSFVANILRPPVDSRWFGFKEIRYDAFGDSFPQVMDFIRTHFKNAHIVFNTRSVDAVAKSSWWANWEPAKVRELIQRMDNRFAAYADTHPQGSTLVRYEDVSTNPEALRDLFAKLDEPFDRALVEQVMSHRLTH